jgi:hypothetical protein
MLPPFDIFGRENGQEVWIKSVEDFKSARLAVKELMAVSPHEYIIHSHRTNNELVVKPRSTAKPKAKPRVFQIAYDETLMASRAALLKSDGFAVLSVLGNEAAKAALEKTEGFSLFIMGHGSPPTVRREMADWLKTNYPNVPILALNPPYQQELAPADYNLVLNGPEEWLFVVEASTA